MDLMPNSCLLPESRSSSYHKPLCRLQGAVQLLLEHVCLLNTPGPDRMHWEREREGKNEGRMFQFEDIKYNRQQVGGKDELPFPKP